MSEDKEQQKEALKKQYLEELQNDPRVHVYTASIQDSCIVSLLESYAKNKASLKVYGNYTEYRKKSLIEEWTNEAWQALREIQHKKLFDQQCLWRAEERGPMPDIEITHDFGNVAKYILDYGAIPDITREEVEEYMDFIESRAEILPYYYFSDKSYQDYENIKKSVTHTQNEEIDYYEYMHIKYGTHSLLNLPDIRYEKEVFYARLGYREQQKTQKNTITNTPNPSDEETKKDLYHWDIKTKIAFARHIGDYAIANFIKDEEEWKRKKPSSEVSDAIRYLLRCHPEEIPVKKNINWQEAVINTRVKHSNLKIREYLPSVYEMYMIKKQTQVKIEDHEKHRDRETISDFWKEKILKGRELNGEPRDFNF